MNIRHRVGYQFLKLSARVHRGAALRLTKGPGPLEEWDMEQARKKITEWAF